MSRRYRVLLACSLFASSVAMAQTTPANWPVRPVTFVIPYAPGSATETDSRLYANKLTENLGQQFVLDFKPGGSTLIAAQYTARAAGDGHTLMIITATFPLLPLMFKDSAFDPIKSFAAVTQMSERSTLFVISNSLPASNVKEYIAYSRANPEKLRMVTPGVCSTHHLNGAWLHILIDTKVTFVHYKSTALNLTDLLAGRTEVFLGTGLSALPHLKTGKLKLLAVANGRRSPMLPGALTIAEQGVAGYDYSSMFGIITTGGVPASIVDRVGAELGKIAAIPDVIKRIEADGGFMVGSTPAQFRQIIASEVTRYRKIVQEGGIKLED